MENLTVLFWNIDANPKSKQIVEDLAKEHGVDLIVFIESIVEEKEENEKGKNKIIGYKSVTPNISGFNSLPIAPICKKIQLFWKHDVNCLKIIYDSSRQVIYRITLPNQKDLTFVFLHFPDKKSQPEINAGFHATAFARSIEITEASEGHKRTIVLGDFNMNPFEHGMVSAMGFHALGNKSVVEKTYREVLGFPYYFFYNPMWQFLGNTSGNATGTYHLTHNQPVCYFHNIFDQILLRPSLMNCLKDETIQIISKKEIQSFAGSEISDHQPVLFSLDLSKL